MTPEQKARVSIDVLLKQAGWHVCDIAHANIHAARGVALREFPLNSGYGFADYLLSVIQSSTCQTYIQQASGSIAQAHLYIKDMRSRPIPLPPISEQDRIVAKVDRRLSLILEVQTEVGANLKRAQGLLQSTLSRAFQQVP